jgi:hypothetical protein
MRLSVWLLLQQQVEAAQALNSDCFGCEIAEYGRRVVRRPPDNAPGCASYCQVNSSKNTQRSVLCFLSSTWRDEIRNDAWQEGRHAYDVPFVKVDYV